jgi:hypothetical protein
MWVSINRMRGAWPWTHVGKESFKIKSPAIADAYTARSIMIIETVSRIFAAVNNPEPYLMLWRFGFAMRDKCLAQSLIS